MKRALGKSNLDIVKDYVDGVRPFVQVGYDSNLENSTRKEGEEWEDGQGRKWVWKNGSKRRVSKRATLVIEQRCTCCNMDVRWGSYLDDRVWPKTQMCYECFTNEETRLKTLGIWDTFNKIRELKNVRSALQDYKQRFEETKIWCTQNHGKPIEFSEEDGSIERWSGAENYSKVLEDVTKDLESINERLSNIDAEIVELEIKYESAKLKRDNKKRV
jgi:hypothetical protein